jgi:hypothetical protein
LHVKRQETERIIPRKYDLVKVLIQADLKIFLEQDLKFKQNLDFIYEYRVKNNMKAIVSLQKVIYKPKLISV